MPLSPHWSDDLVTLYHGDCLDVLRGLDDASVDAVVTDPPYDLTSGKKGGTGVASVNLESPYGRSRIGTGNGPGGFMGKQWDATGIAFDPTVWIECLRVLKPGGHLLAFGGTRTWHRLASAIEDAGFEIRDSIAWLYGSGFPKSLDVSKAIDKAASKAIDKAAGAEREVVGVRTYAGGHVQNSSADALAPPIGTFIRTQDRRDETTPATPDARTWQGWGTALKPAFEPIVVGRKPLIGTGVNVVAMVATGLTGSRAHVRIERLPDGSFLWPEGLPRSVAGPPTTVAANVLQHGTGALNIDACRVAAGDVLVRPAVARHDNDVLGTGLGVGTQVEPAGRWPANVVLDDTQAAELDRQGGGTSVNGPARWVGGTGASSTGWGDIGKAEPGEIRSGFGDEGGASRFFPTFHYEPKAPTHERPRVAGASENHLDAKDMECRNCGKRRQHSAGWECVCDEPDFAPRVTSPGTTAHPTVKPLDLMRWLVRLVTPPGGAVLDPFAGSGTTAEACVIEGFTCITIEREADYLPLIVQRLTKPIQPDLFG